MNICWDALIEVLPNKKYIDTLGVYYRPWIKDKSHLFLARFIARTDTYINSLTLPNDIPRFLDAFGYTADQAIDALTLKLKEFKEKT